MKQFLILFAVLILGTFSLYGQKPMEEDPNVMWTYKDASFTTYPAIHPNGNVLIGDGNKGDVIELNGLTGELIRRIPIPAPTSSLILSKDGTRMAASGYIIDIENGEVINAHPRAAAVRFLHPNNNIIIYTLFNQKDTSWVIWDMEKNTSQNYKIPYLVTSIEVSNDGRFLAVGAKDFEGEPHTHFYLYNAQTMELIHELEDVPAEGRTIEFIQFSENAKYVGYGNKPIGTPKSAFFSCEQPYKIFEFKNSSGHNYHSMGFIFDEYTYMSGQSIWNIADSKEIYFSNKYISNNPIHNKVFNTLLVWDISTPTLVTLDFNKILNSVSVEEPKEPIQKFVTEYRKGILKITGFENISPIIHLSISDLQGNVVFHNQVQIVNGRIEVTIPLPSGAYILRIQDGQNNFSSKFLVME